MNHNDRIDKILHEALGEYRQAEPLAGLEDRVLRRIQSQQQSHTASWPRWGFVAACLAALMLVIWIGLTRRTPPAATPAGEVASQPTVVSPRQEPGTPANGSILLSEDSHARSGLQRRAPPASDARTESRTAMSGVFPVPMPLSDKERTFVAALERHPEAVRTTPASDATPVIAQIEIKPLSTNDEVSGEDQ